MRILETFVALLTILAIYGLSLRGGTYPIGVTLYAGAWVIVALSIMWILSRVAKAREE